MERLGEKGIHVVALADHNTGEWVDEMVAAGERNNVVVFPGTEITTGSGADGIHVIVIGARSKTTSDVERLLAGEIGFTNEHPPFQMIGGQRVPQPSGRTILKILDGLPDDYLVIAPHAFNDNGIAAANTARGDIRWRALHHPRLVAVDPGDCSAPDGDTFNDRFRRRELTNFPILPDMAFVATSDAYALDTLGSRYTWIRMDEPTLEALRQAFLDHDARIRCDWDPRLAGYSERDPNRVRHAWIERVAIEGDLGNSDLPLGVFFHPGLNTIIGGRGSGKSTIVAAIRQLYGGFRSLPGRVKEEAEQFASAIFSGSDISATHHVANSQHAERALWSEATGPVTESGEERFVPTSFRVRVVNQKELFERVSAESGDALSASRSFLAFVDESLGLLKGESPRPGTWWHRFDEARQDWIRATQELHRLKSDLSEVPAIEADIRTLEGQLTALDSDEARGRRERNEKRIAEHRSIEQVVEALRGTIGTAMELGSMEVPVPELSDLDSKDVRGLLDDLVSIGAALRNEVGRAARQAERLLEEWRSRLSESQWNRDYKRAVDDAARYLEELEDQGVDPDAYEDLRSQLSGQRELLRSLTSLKAELSGAQSHATMTWRALIGLLEERRATRLRLLESVSHSSGSLKFELVPYRDTIKWVRAVRELIGVRADGFLEDVPSLADWLWANDDEGERHRRWDLWRESLISGDLREIGLAEAANLRSSWQERLEGLDDTVRLLVAAEIPDDAVRMSFLREGGEPSNEGDWQEITSGSPGQRTAAMLGFVLHHGTEPLVLDQPEDDLDTSWISNLVVRELRESRWRRQIIVVTHNANIPVNADAEQVIALENTGTGLRVRESVVDGEVVQHCGAIERRVVREDIQRIMEGGIAAFIRREQRYNNELSLARRV